MTNDKSADLVRRAEVIIHAAMCKMARRRNIRRRDGARNWAREAATEIRSALTTDAGDGWRDMADAPKDGRLLVLLIDYTDGGGSLEDENVGSTIGFNNLDNTGDDEWQFAGWCWQHDHFVEGSGKVIGWSPFVRPAPTATEGDA